MSERTYNFPTEVSYDVTVKYVIRNVAPTVAVSKSTIDLNKYTADSENVTVSYKNFAEGTTVDGVVLDSKGKELPAPLPLDVEIESAEESAIVNIKVTDKAQAGQTYKVRLAAKNTANGRKGAAKDVNVRIVADSKAAVGKLGLAIKAASGTSLDASQPTRPLIFTVTGKNFNTFGKKPEISVLAGNQIPITGLFDIPDSADGKTFTVSEKFDEDNYFALLNKYAGQKVSINVTYRIDDKTTVSGILKTTIKKTTVTPKLKATKISINPDYNKGDIIVPITNLPEKVYDYKVSVSFGKKDSAVKVPFTAEVVNSEEYPGQDLLKITPITKDMPSALGKTCTVTILPEKTVTGSNPIALSAKAASLKITVLDTGKKKNAVALTAKAKGSIDSLKPETGVTATIGIKNVYDPESVLGEITCESIVLGKSTEDIKDEFGVTASGSTLVISNRYHGSLAAGSYKAKIVAVLTDAKGTETALTTTLTFKVTRSKTGLKAVSSQGTIYNRDFNNFARFKFSKKAKNVNGISKVKPSAAYEGKYDVTVSEEGPDHVTIAVGFAKKTGYYEKGITKAVTRKIPVEVYYYGSSTPDKVTVTVTVKP